MCEEKLYTKQFLQLLTKSKKPRIKHHTWKNRDGTLNIINHKIYAQYLGEKFGYNKMEDWYKLTTKQMFKNYGYGILAQHYNNSHIKFIKNIFPDYDWLEWKFNVVPKKFWKDMDNRKKYAIWLGKELKYNKMKDWYKLTQDIMDNRRGGTIIAYYDGSPKSFVMDIFPEYEWLDWKFVVAGRNYWQSANNRRKYAIWLGKELGYEKMEDWYNFNRSDATTSGRRGHGIFNYYNGSPIQFVIDIFPEYEWLEWKFNFVPQGYWKNINNLKKYAIWLGKELGYNKREDWYKLTLKDIRAGCGCGAEKRFKSSTALFVMKVFPEFNWLEWKFKRVPLGFWNDKDNRKKYFIWLGKELGYEKMEDWYNLLIAHFQENRGYGMLEWYDGGRRFGARKRRNIYEIAMEVFPDFKWEKSKFIRNISRGQIQWLKLLMIETPDIRHKLNHSDGEYYIPNSYEFCCGPRAGRPGGQGYYADGFSKKEHIIYEYLGDNCHGNPSIYKPDYFSNWVKATAGELYNKELKRRKFCEDSGFGYHSIWESEWHRGIRAIVQLQRKFKNRITAQ